SLDITPVVDENGVVTHVISRHSGISEARHREIQSRQTQRMISIGRLASGIAHDFNNLLTVIIGCSEVLMMSGIADPQKMLQQIKEAGERGRALTDQLLAYSRDQVVERRPLCINDILANLGRTLPRMIGED